MSFCWFCLAPAPMCLAVSSGLYGYYVSPWDYCGLVAIVPILEKYGRNHDGRLVFFR